METVRQADQNCWNDCILGFSELLDSRTVRFSELLDNWIVGQSDSWIVQQSDCWKFVRLSKLLDC